ncbi:MAG: ABC transporter permease [Oleiphilaceae bacterium]|nr:ABC transporter permease [Oleiphilaceae bacterium]
MTLLARLKLAAASLRHRRGPVLLTLITLTLSLTLVLGVQYLRSEVKQSFVSTLSGTDLIVGARSGPMNLLLYSVFHIGNPTNNIRWSSYQHVAEQPAVDWVVPMTLGDAHQGYRVIATNRDFFERFRYGNRHSLELASGRAFDDLYEVVLGADVARNLDYEPGDELAIAHGGGSTSFVNHDDKPFRVSGILAPTGTPLDRTLQISLEAFEAIHLGWQSGVPAPGRQVSAEQARERDLTPDSITAMLVGVNRPIMTLRLQRELNNYRGEPLTAILPGATLSELWRLMGSFERALMVITALVLFTSLAGLAAVLLTIQGSRNREMAILRSVGASPATVALLFVSEALLLVALAALLALGLWFGGLALLAPWLSELWGVHIALRPPQALELGLLGGAMGLALLVSLLPAWAAYRRSLSEGLTPRE